jgi:hypothetical protein
LQLNKRKEGGVDLAFGRGSYDVDPYSHWTRPLRYAPRAQSADSLG